MTEREIKGLKGLSDADVAEKRKKDGYNELPDAGKRGIFKIILEVFTEPMFLLLVVCGVVYLLVGEPQDAIMLLGFVVIMMTITIVQEGKTEKSLEALRDLSSPRAKVMRNGVQITIPGREVVSGDLVILAEGERVSADGVLIWNAGLSVDESLLTGESVPVRKQSVDAYEDAASAGDSRPGGDDSPWTYSGTLVVSGQAVMLVRNIGARTEMGRIGKALAEVEKEDTLLQKETGRVVKSIFVIAIILCAVVVVVYGLTRGSWLDAILSGITLAMAMLPEEFPVVLTVFLALGAWRLSRKNVLARKVSAVETLGAATVLCSDKTGTITQNRMSVASLWIESGKNGGTRFTVDPEPQKIPEAFHEMVECGVLASRKDPFDPMEKAFLKILSSGCIDGEHSHPDWDIVREYPLSKKFLSVTQVWKSSHGGDLVVAVKGAPETIMDLCHLDEARKAVISAEIARMAGDGLRVLGVARGAVPESQDLPETQHDFDFSFCGLVGLADPIRPAVPGAIALCREAGIRVVMITGDYPQTAVNIARSIGLANPDTVITGSELVSMSPGELSERVKTCQVFARVVPEQKLLLVQALRANGEVVAMTGDGVNDAPALKAAHIGVAMGERGTDVAREASALVLLDDDFSSIVSAVRTGRRIFDNLKKAMCYIVSVHIPIAGLSLIPVLLAWKEQILLPVHIVFLELIIDPACSIVFEGQAEEKNVMSRAPRAANESLFSARTVGISLLQGFVALASVFAVYFVAGAAGAGVNGQRTLAFICLIATNLALILSNRSWSEGIVSSFREKNSALGWVLAGASFFLILVVTVPFLESLFHFATPTPACALAAAGIGLLSVAWFEILKFVWRVRGKSLLQDSRNSI
jgi:Ca2+-transporting ATPase